MRPTATLLLLCLYLAPAGVNAALHEAGGRHFETGPAPDWLTPALEVQAVAASEYGRDAAVRYLLVDEQVSLREQGQMRSWRIVGQPLRPSGVERAAEISIDFDPEYQRLILHHVRVIRDGKASTRLDPDQVRLLQRERSLEESIYDGSLTAFLLLEDVRQGDLVDYAYTVVGENPIFNGRYFDSFDLAWSVPVARRRIYIHDFTERTLRQKTLAGDARLERESHAGHVDFGLELTELPIIKGESSLPYWYVLYPVLQVGEFADWQHVARWAAKLYAGRLQATGPESVAAKLAQGAPDKAEYARRALRFVQNEIRYFGIEFGANSHLPSAPAETLQRRYGDCKDKSVLLISLLHARGIDAWPALVSSEWRRGIADMLPTPGAFDHVIVLARIDGRDYWLDPTSTYQGGTLENTTPPAFGKALVVAAGSRELADIPRPASLHPDVRIDEHYAIQDDRRTALLEITTSYRGGEADYMRYNLSEKDAETIQQQYLDYFAKLHPGIEHTRPLEFEDDRERNIISVREHYRIPDFLVAEQNKEYFEIFANAFDSYLKAPDSAARTIPLGLRHPLRVEHHARFEYYDSISWNTEAPVRLEAPGFVYNFKAAGEGKIFSRHHVYASRSDHVMPDELSAYGEAVDKVNAQLPYQGEIGYDTPANRHKNPLMEMLRQLFGD